MLYSSLTVICLPLYNFFINSIYYYYYYYYYYLVILLLLLSSHHVYHWKTRGNPDVIVPQ